MTALLSVKEMSKSYHVGKNNTHEVLKNISLEIEKGEFVSIMGPSGSGKSTLLYCVSGMDKPTSGDVEFAGSSIQAMNEKELSRLRLTQMGFVFQQSNLLKNLSIFDNIVISAYLGKQEDKTAINRRATELMVKVGILGLANHDITQASGGELQRASICRALINNPVILFGDEPTGALNSSAACEVLEILDSINKEGCTILLVTHDTKVAARSSRVLFMMDGGVKGELSLGKYLQDADNWKERESNLSEWLTSIGF